VPNAPSAADPAATDPAASGPAARQLASRRRRLAAETVVLPEGVTPAGTRGRILRAGLALFAEHGFHGASIRELATAAGITSATLYAHYPAKDQVLADLVRIGHEELHTRLAEAAASAKEPARQLAALVRAHTLLHADYAMLAVVTNNELHALSTEQAAPALALRAESFRLLVEVVRAGVRRGEFSVPDPLLAAMAISSMGLRVAHWFGTDQPYSRERVADDYTRFALRIVGATEAAPDIDRTSTKGIP
jgi:AcrR family transcriptional regulator